MRPFACTVFISNKDALLHFWWKKISMKYLKVSKSHDHASAGNFVLFHMSSITTPNLKKNIFWLNFFLLSRKLSKTKLQAVLLKNSTHWKVQNSSLQVIATLALLSKPISLIFSFNSINGPRVTKWVKRLTIEAVHGELWAKSCFQVQTWKEYFETNVHQK